MDALTSSNKSYKMEVFSADLLSLLDQYANQIKILSLDCFDTLIWRNTAAPRDVFFHLESKFTFKSAGLSAKLRQRAEIEARRNRFLQFGTSEVKLIDIYKAALPSASELQIKSLILEELESEEAACFAFSPMVELIRVAHDRGLKIIIVSDIYFEETQLRHLLKSKLPEDVYNKINKVFCSCDYGKAKSDGLFKYVLERTQQSPNAILHLGDNHRADFVSPQVVGIKSAKFLQFTDGINEALRMQTIAAPFVDPTIRNVRSHISPYRAIFATDRQSNDKGESLLGYATAGPIMYGFARFILDEVARMQANNKKTKVLFLMRDAYLPSLACEALAGESVGHHVRISRFASIAASFRSKADVDSYLADNVLSLRFHDICRQFLLSEDIAHTICTKAEKASSPIREFLKLVTKENILQNIFAASTAYRQRMWRYLQKEAKIQQGDTLLFVDLGYTGTAQKLLEPVFREEFGVEIFGCYLIALRVPNWQTTRKGLLDPTVFDDSMLSMLVTHIPVLEQICTSNGKSVIDYTENGEPLYSDISVAAQQHDKLDAIQQECIRFVKDAKQFFENEPLSLEILRDAAAINLSRLIFLPTAKELAFLKTFEFELNLGTKDVMALFDANQGLNGLRRRGWLHCTKNNMNKRANYAAEWRSANLELALTLMAQHRFNLEFALSDLSHRQQELQIRIFHAGESTSMSLQATSTHDGYYSVMIPIVNPDCQVGIQFGKDYSWVELESAEMIKLLALYTEKEMEETTNVNECLMVHDMQDKGGGLFECSSFNSLLIFSPPKKIAKNENVLRIIFRPIVYRDHAKK